MFRKIALVMMLLVVSTLAFKPAAAQCNDVQSSPATWPDGAYTQTCPPAIYGTDMLSGLNFVSQDAQSRLTAAKATFYDFATPSDYAASTVPPNSEKQTPTTTAVGLTPRNGSFKPFAIEYSAIFETSSSGIVNYLVKNVTAHETGHQVSYLYASAANATRLIVGGTARIGDTVTVTVHNTGLAGGTKSDSYTVQNTDTLVSIASEIAQLLSNDQTLQTIHVRAQASGQYVSVSAQPTLNVTYSGAISAGGTETLTFTNGVLPSDSTAEIISGSAGVGDVFTITVHAPSLNIQNNGEVTVSYTEVKGDTAATIATHLATALNANTNLIANDITATANGGAVIIQSLSAGPGGSTTYTQSVTGSGGTITNTSDFFASNSKLFNHELAYDWEQINALPSCGPGGFFTSKTQNVAAFPPTTQPTYFCDGNQGTGSDLVSPWNNTTKYPVSTRNRLILQAAYNDIFTTFGANNGTTLPFNANDELFAELYAIAVGQSDSFFTEGNAQNMPGIGDVNYQSSDQFINSQNSFHCTYTLVQEMTEAGVLPTSSQWGNCPIQ